MSKVILGSCVYNRGGVVCMGGGDYSTVHENSWLTDSMSFNNCVAPGDSPNFGRFLLIYLSSESVLDVRGGVFLIVVLPERHGA